MKSKRLLCVVLCIMMVIGIMPVMNLTVSADSTYYVGRWYSAPTYEVTTEYGPSTWSFEESAPSMVKYNENFKKMRFTKPGKVTIVTNWYKTDVIGSTLKPRYGSFENKYEAIMPTAESIDSTSITVESAEFIGGNLFPKFYVRNKGSEYIETTEAYYTSGNVDYYVYDRLPLVVAGKKERVQVKIIPIYGYYFDKNKQYDVTYNGNKYKAYVMEEKDSHDMPINYLIAYVDVTFSGGVICDAFISDLDVPVNGDSVFDKTAYIGDHCDVTQIEYYLDGEDPTVVKYGDELTIRVYVKGDENHTFKEGGTAYWKDAGLFSLPGVKQNTNTGYFDFTFKVNANNAQIINTVVLNVKQPYESQSAQSRELSSATYGVVPYGEAEWTFWSTNMAGFTCDVKAGFKLSDNEEFYVLNPDFAEEGTVYINGVKATRITEDKSNPGVYYAEASLEVVKYGRTVTVGTEQVDISNNFSNYELNRPSASNYVTFFDGNNQYLGSEAKHIGGSGVKYTFDIPENAVYGKLMLWQDNGSIKPLAEPIHVEVPVPPITAYIENEFITVDDGEVVDVSVSASGGKGKYIYQWQYRYYNYDKLDWTSWENVSADGKLGEIFKGDLGANTIQVKGSVNNFSKDELRLRCIVKDSYGYSDVTDNVAKVEVDEIPIEAVISTSAVAVPYGESIDINAIAYYGGGNYTYEWYYTENDTNWFKISLLDGYQNWFEGEKTAKLTIKAPSISGKPEGLKVRCQIKSDNNWTIKTDSCVIAIDKNSFYVDLVQSAYSIKENGLALIMADVKGGQSPYKCEWQFKEHGSAGNWLKAIDYPAVFRNTDSNSIFIGVVADKKTYPNGIDICCIVTDEKGTVRTSSKNTYIRFE